MKSKENIKLSTNSTSDRIRELEKGLWDEKQLTATLSDALEDFEAQSFRMKKVLEATRKQMHVYTGLVNQRNMRNQIMASAQARPSEPA